MSVGKSCAGIAACDNTPNGPQKKKPGALPIATAACVKYWSGVSPESCWIFETLITALLGMKACPAATTRLSRSMPMNWFAAPPPKAGQVKPPAWICASVKLEETQNPPGNNEAPIAAAAILGLPKKPRGYENGWTAR